MSYLDYLYEQNRQTESEEALQISSQPVKGKLRATNCRVGAHKFALWKVRINRGGYDTYGQYFGTGAPIWHGECMCGHHALEFFRAPTRAAAKATVRRMHTLAARFYR
jgi:cysteinyl-tRNA synthetase